MIPAWLLVVAVLGVNFTLWGTIGLLRVLVGRKQVAQPATRLTVDDVAVLMAAHNEELVITDSLESVARLLPRHNIHVVSDGSTDRTVDLARLQGVHVIETPRNVGKAGAFEEGIKRFGLVEQYQAVLLLDADTRLESDYFEHTLPLFDNDRIVAVAGCATSDWSTPPRTTLGALLVTHRARIYALTQRLLKFGQTWQPTNATFIVPGFASMYRTRALPHIKIDRPGLVIEDFNMTFEVYRQRLGKVGFSLGGKAATQDPDTFEDYLKQTRRWALGFWQSVRKHRLRPNLFSAMLCVYVLEVVVSSVLLVVAPVLLVLLLLPEVLPELANWAVSAEIEKYVNARSIVLGVLVPDLVLTLGVAIAERRGRYLLFAAFYLPMRVVDAVTALRTLPRAWLEHSTGRWVSPARRALTQSGTRRAVVPKLGALLAGVAALAVVLRVALVSATLPASVAEQRLVDSAFGESRDLTVPGPDAGLALSELQLSIYASLTRAFERHDVVLLAGRELSVVATGVAVLSVVALLVYGLRLRPVAVGIAVLLLDSVRRPALLAPAVVIAVLVAVAGTLFTPRTGRSDDHLALAAWITEHTTATTILTAPPGLWSELVRTGLPPARVHREGPASFEVVRGAGSGHAVARFGGYTIQQLSPPSIEDKGTRASAGRQLATNPRLLVSDEAGRALREGEVDLRAMTVLAGLSATHQLVIAEVRSPEAERGRGLPRREVVVSAVDGRGLDYPQSKQVLLQWLVAQQAPYAPASTRITPQGAVITWQVREES